MPTETLSARAEHRGLGSRGSLELAAPLTVGSEAECNWYHTFTKPDGSLIRGPWDYRHNVDEYLGHVDFRGKSVIEIGPASGFLTIAMEQRGASVTAIDVSEDEPWEPVPRVDRDIAQWIRSRRPHMVKLKKSWWYAQKLFNCSADISYCGVSALNDLVDTLEFDMFLIGGILQHVRYPMDLLWAASKIADRLIVTERFLPKYENTGPVAEFLPAGDNDVIGSWWQFTSGAVTNAMNVFGFERTGMTRFDCRMWDLRTPDIERDTSREVPMFNLLFERRIARDRRLTRETMNQKVTTPAVVNQNLRPEALRPEALRVTAPRPEPPRPDAPRLEDLRREMNTHFWWHTIDLGRGLVTPGKLTAAFMKQKIDAVFSRVSVAGKTVLDVGSWNGAYAIEAKRRGAKKVVALDHHAWNDPRLRGRAAFDFAVRCSGLEIEAVERDLAIPNALADIPSFDIILFLGVFYHLLDPLQVLQQLGRLTQECLIVETQIEELEDPRPAMVFYPTTELGGDATNWWGPNIACVEALLRTVGFASIDTLHFTKLRGLFHAWKPAA